MSDKRALRAAARADRDVFDDIPHDPIRADPAFVRLLRAGLTVASYIPIGSEADPSPLVELARNAGCRIALPHVVDRATPLVFLPWNEEVALESGPLGLRQPARGAIASTPDIVLTPLVAFDRALNRLGQGAGYYDRAFVDFPAAARIGIAWSIQELPACPTDPWDVPLHAIATEKEWITP